MCANIYIPVYLLMYVWGVLGILGAVVYCRGSGLV